MTTPQEVLSKPFWTSKTIRFNVVAALVTLVTFLIDNEFFASNETAGVIAGVVVSVGNIALRFITDTGVHIRKPDVGENETETN